MPLRDDLLNPIAGDNPAGVDLRYDPIYEKIKEARREDDDAPQGEWQRTRKVADWPLVIKLAGDALATRSKDLQLAAWLGEAMLRREGFGAFRGMLDVTRGLLDSFWDTVYPEIEDGDLEMRAAPLEWIGLKLDLPAKMAALNRAGHSYLQYAEARSIDRAGGRERRGQAREARRSRRGEEADDRGVRQGVRRHTQDVRQTARERRGRDHRSAPGARRLRPRQVR